MLAAAWRGTDRKLEIGSRRHPPVPVPGHMDGVRGLALERPGVLAQVSPALASRLDMGPTVDQGQAGLKRFGRLLDALPGRPDSAPQMLLPFDICTPQNV